MGRVVLLVAVIGLGVYSFVAALQADAARIRVMPRWLWVAVIVVIPVIGPLAWLLTGQSSQAAIDDEGPLGPEDDPDFLHRL
jgi:hypothetical protein